MAQDNVKPSRFANLPGWAYLILTGLLVAGWGAAIYALFRLLPTWEHRILVGLLTFLAFMLAWMTRNMRESEADRNCAPIPDAASVEEQEAALAQALELAVLFFKLLEPFQLRRSQSAIFLAPVVERGIRDAHLPADLFDRRSHFGLLQRKRDLLFRELRSLHSTTSISLGENCAGISSSKRFRFPG